MEDYIFVELGRSLGNLSFVPLLHTIPLLIGFNLTVSFSIYILSISIINLYQSRTWRTPMTIPGSRGLAPRAGRSIMCCRTQEDSGLHPISTMRTKTVPDLNSSPSKDSER
jgi:hypothetical protein